jgi:tetratricopeptide (TPR) repeat protein
VFLLEILDPLIAMDDFAAKHEMENGQSVTLPKESNKGFYWEFWIKALTQLFERHGLSVAARKDADKKHLDEQSPFVRFVSKFQEHLPEQCRRFTQSNDALAQGIYRVRHGAGGSYKAEIENEAKKAFAAADRLIEQAEQAESAKLARPADARTWRLRDFRAALDATLNPTLSRAERAEVDEKMKLCLASNEVVDLVREGKLDAAEGAAGDLLTRFPDAHDGHDRLGMVHEARGDKRKAAECYREAIKVIRRHPEDYESGFAKTFAELVKRLDPPAKHARSVRAAGHKGRSKPPAT